MVIRIGAAALGVAASAIALLVAGMRWKLSPVVDGVRRFNRAVTNPRVLRSAGAAGAPTSVIQHVGRTTGRVYETPVDTVPTATGFLIALPYGTRADWLRNVLTAESATILSGGERIAVDTPSIVATADVAGLIPKGTRRILRLFGVAHCLHLERVSSPT